MLKHLTKTSVEAIEPGDRDVYAWDDKVGGFGVKITPKGARVYLLKYRARGAQRWLVIGRHGEGEMTAEKARQQALRLRGVVADGKDPAAARDADRGSPTMVEFGERYMAEYA
ncbi:MAG TPA: Arm DNA-binding domain-containing protein, partial [Stellaceae bacterium]|nr:Arm DNA-binding domain-containing protein [Stellaceae bacterium]